MGVITLTETDVMDPEKIRRSSAQVKAAICYIFEGEKALMIIRKKEPFLGYMVAPGGKFEKGETPLQCIKREIMEETGLNIKKCDLKIVTSELGPEHYNWILYIFVCNDFEGNVVESDEGSLRWVETGNLLKEKMSDIDKRILPFVLDGKKYFMKLRYDDDKNCTIEEINDIV